MNAREMIADYGQDVRDTSCSAAFLRAVETVGPLSVGQYVAEVRRLAADAGVALPEPASQWDADAHWAGITRLIAAGHNRWAPRHMARALPSLLRWVKHICPLRRVSDTAQSPYAHSPAELWEAWRAGVPAWAFAALYGCRPVHGYPYPPALVGRLPRRQLTPAQRERWIRAGRAAARHSVAKTELVFTFKALEQLGRLSVELQEAALEGVEMIGDRPIVPSQLNWDRACEMQALFLRRPELRAAMARGKRRPADITHPAWPLAKGRMAARLLLGDTPQQLALARCEGAQLTRREAHEWLAHNPAAHPVEHTLGFSVPASTLREPAVVAWLLDLHRRGRSGQLTRERTMRHEGQTYRYRYVDRLDEVRAADVADHPPVDEVMERAARRYSGHHVEQWRADSRVISQWPEHWPAMPDGWRLLDTPAALVARGDTERHCVGGYVAQVAAGECWIVAIDRDGQRSTAQLDQERRCVQHYGPCNQQPAPELAAELAAWLS